MRSLALPLSWGLLPTLIALTAASAQAQADTTAAPAPRGPFAGFVVAASGELGGDPVATVEYTDGSTQDVDGGQGVTLSVGGELRPSYTSPLVLRATVGYKYVTTAAENLDVTLTRIPVEVLGAYEFDGGFWAGAGVVHQSAIRFKVDDESFDLEPATGPIVRFGWRWLSASYTSMSYTDAQGNEYDASSFGIGLTHTFGRRR